MKTYKIILHLVSLEKINGRFVNEAHDATVLEAVTANEAWSKGRKMFKGRNVKLSTGQEAFINSVEAKIL